MSLVDEHSVPWRGSWRRFQSDFPFVWFLPHAAAIIVIVISFHPAVSSWSNMDAVYFRSWRCVKGKDKAPCVKRTVKLGKEERQRSVRLSACWGSVHQQDALFYWRNRVRLGQLFLTGGAVIKRSWLRHLFVNVFGISAHIFQCPDQLGLR